MLTAPVLLTRAEIAKKVIDNTTAHLDADPDKVSEKANFVDDLGADSLDYVELVMVFEEEFDVEITDEEAESVHTVGDAVELIARKLAA